MGRQLKIDQLVRLEKHSYSSTSSSLLDPYMQHYWCWLVEQCPLSLAPNLITIMGLLINIVTCLILIYYSPDAKKEVPSWACFLCAVGLFVYQSLDAIDGKQARRTGTSSPLGELFDHGCDSLSTVFVSLSVCCAVQLGSHPYWMFFQCVTALCLFYCAHWQTYVSGSLRFGLIDVTEAQITVIFILMISAVFGSGFWDIKLPSTNLALKCVPTLLGTSAGCAALFENFRVILVERGAGRNGSTVAIGFGDVTFKEIGTWVTVAFQIIICYSNMHALHKSGAGKNGSTVAGTSVLSPVVPLFLVVAPAVIVAWKSAHGIYLTNPCLYLLTFGFVSARVTNRLVVAHMTKSEMDYTDPSMLGPAALFLNQYFNTPISERFLLILVFLYVTCDLVKYCSNICLDICDHLKIRLFVIDVSKSNLKSSGEKNGAPVSKYNTRTRSRAKMAN